MLHPEVSTPDPVALSKKGDVIWRDIEVLEAFNDLGWKGLSEFAKSYCETNVCLLWCHNTLRMNNITANLFTDERPDHVVGCLRDPLLMFLTGLARCISQDSYAWLIGRTVPWFKQYYLWQAGKIELLPVDLWGSFGEEKRVRLVTEFLQRIGLRITVEVEEYVRCWRRAGSFVHSGSKEPATSPIKSHSQELKEAYYNREIEPFQQLMPNSLAAARLVIETCMSMFTSYGYDFWWADHV